MPQASLSQRAYVQLAAFGLTLGLALFLSAGSAAYWQGWVFLASFLGAAGLTTYWLLNHDRALVERRMHGGPSAETRPLQRLIQSFTLLGFFGLVVIPALDWRFGWSPAPAWVSVLGNAMVLAGYFMVARVFVANSFAAATVQVAEGQTVISTGPYALVRHPMYAAAALIIFGAPLALGSYWGLIAGAAIMAGIVVRLFDEERFLVANLPGYDDYRRKVRFRLAPGIF